MSSIGLPISGSRTLLSASRICSSVAIGVRLPGTIRTYARCVPCKWSLRPGSPHAGAARDRGAQGARRGHAVPPVPIPPALGAPGRRPRAGDPIVAAPEHPAPASPPPRGGRSRGARDPPDGDGRRPAADALRSRRRRAARGSGPQAARRHPVRAAHDLQAAGPRRGARARVGRVPGRPHRTEAGCEATVRPEPGHAARWARPGRVHASVPAHRQADRGDHLARLPVPRSVGRASCPRVRGPSRAPRGDARRVPPCSEDDVVRAPGRADHGLPADGPGGLKATRTRVGLKSAPERADGTSDAGGGSASTDRWRQGGLEMETGSPIVPEFNSWLEELVKGEGSDLHVKVGSPPMIRLPHGLIRLERDPLSPIETQAIADGIVPGDRKATLVDRGDVDFAYSVANIGRFRANVFRQRGSVSMVLRKLRFGGPSFEEMGLPDAVRKLADEHRGLILVTGPTGSGKTTTLAAMIAYINRTKPVHIVTIEDPIEVLHRDDVASINQREIGNDTEDFLAALRAALRQDPDVILIGEMRDPETVRAALQAAETGHLVLSTLHTTDATETVNRVIDFFPPYQQKQVRLALAASLRGIVCQRLVPTVDGGRVPALEILVNTGRVAERIEDPDTTSEIKEVIKDGAFYGMVTFDQWLLRLIQEGTVSVADAMQAVSSRHDFELAMQQAGIAVPV